MTLMKVTKRYALEEAIEDIRTVHEQQMDPYPSNVFTSCFYKYLAVAAASPPKNAEQITQTTQRANPADDSICGFFKA